MLKDLVTEKFEFGLNKPKKNGNSLWLDKYKPKLLAETAVHKAKITELEICFEKVLSGKVSFVLLIGPSGSAKTTTLNLMAKKLKIEVSEWLNPVNEDNFSKNDEFKSSNCFFESQQVKFSDFLFRASRYNSLAFSNETNVHKISIIKDFPNFLWRDPSKLKELLVQHKKMSTSNALFFVVTDTEQSSNIKRRLFPASLISDLAIHVVKFNSIAPTCMSKALKRICDLSSQQLPSKQEMESMIEESKGDIRWACNLLQFVCNKNHNTKTKKSKNVSKKFSSNICKNKIAVKNDKQDELISGKDVGVSLFRVLGKILHCKRLPVSTTKTTLQKTTKTTFQKRTKTLHEPTNSLPEHLKHHSRSEMSFDADNIFDKSCLSINLFCSFLHQNYPPFSSTLDQMSLISDLFSQTDVLSHDWSTCDKMTCYQASLITRGLMFAQHPPISKPGWMPLHKPQMLDVNRKKVELLDSIDDHFIHHSNHTHFYTEVLPFHALLSHTSFNLQQNKLLHRISHFSLFSRLETFVDGFDDDNNMQESQYTHSKLTTKSITNPNPLNPNPLDPNPLDTIQYDPNPLDPIQFDPDQYISDDSD